MLEIRNLSKNFGHFPALSHIDLECAPKDRIMLLGSNGAGKTTLLKTMAMLLRPSSGIIRFHGEELSLHEYKPRKKIGFIGHVLSLYQDLTIYENLHFFARLQLLQNPRQQTDITLEEFELSDLKHKTVRSLSKGTQQRVQIASVWMRRPELLLLDEPHSHLDLRASTLLNAKLDLHIQEGGAFILATHQTDLMESLGNRWVVLKNGQKVLDRKDSEIKSGGFLKLYQGILSENQREAP